MVLRSFCFFGLAISSVGDGVVFTVGILGFLSRVFVNRVRL